MRTKPGADPDTGRRGPSVCEVTTLHDDAGANAQFLAGDGLLPRARGIAV
jgi:hypothetical protein